MDIKELLDKISQYDEMEAQDGINLLEAKTKKDILGGKEVKSELLNFGIGVYPWENENIENIYFGVISYGPQIKRLSTADYAGEDVVAEVSNIVEKHLTAMEEEIKALLNLI